MQWEKAQDGKGGKSFTICCVSLSKQATLSGLDTGLSLFVPCIPSSFLSSCLPLPSPPWATVQKEKQILVLKAGDPGAWVVAGQKQWENYIGEKLGFRHCLFSSLCKNIYSMPHKRPCAQKKIVFKNPTQNFSKF